MIKDFHDGKLANSGGDVQNIGVGVETAGAADFRGGLKAVKCHRCEVKAGRYTSELKEKIEGMLDGGV